MSDFGAKLSVRQIGDAILIINVMITVLLLPISTTFVRHSDRDQRTLIDLTLTLLIRNGFATMYCRESGTTSITRHWWGRVSSPLVLDT